MRIPVCHLARYGSIFGAVWYDTGAGRFLDGALASGRELPVQDYMDCTLDGAVVATLVGRVKSRDSFVVCFGDNFLYELYKPQLLQYRLSNGKVAVDGRVVCRDGALQDLGYLFPDSGVVFQKQFFMVQSTSLGVARKFFALYKGHPCIVKFSKRSDGMDLRNEVVYKEVCDKVGVRCCRVRLSEYNGKPCIISLYEYNPVKDVYCSFRQVGRSVSEIYSGLSMVEKDMFNRMMVVDYVLLQQDRHLSNIALLNGGMYPLFDNGECLGLGAISVMSESFRRYVRQLDKGYLRGLFSGGFPNLGYPGSLRCLGELGL